MRFICLGISVVLFIAVSVLPDRKAYAYLDPGTGSYVFQVLIAFLVGSMFAIKIYWRNIVAFFKRLFSKKVING